jgi:hypothetical protein
VTFTTKTTTGTSLAIDNGDKITAIGSRSTELYITDVLPIGEGMTGRCRVLFPVQVSLQKFLSVDTDSMAATYDTAVTVLGQSEPRKVQEWNKTDGPDIKRAQEFVVFNETAAGTKYGAFRCSLVDQLDGLFIANQFTVKIINLITVGGNRITGSPASSEEVPQLLSPVIVSLNDQYDYTGTQPTKLGDAKIVLKQSDITQAQLEAAACIEITPPDGIISRYVIWDGGIDREQTYHWCVYLKRII